MIPNEADAIAACDARAASDLPPWVEKTIGKMIAEMVGDLKPGMPLEDSVKWVATLVQMGFLLGSESERRGWPT